MVFAGKAKEDFNVSDVTSSAMKSFISKCGNIYAGYPEWVKDEGDVKTVNFAKTICSEVARLTTLAIGIKIEGSARAEWLQKQIDNVYYQLRQWTEYASAYGTIVLKPNGVGIDAVMPNDFIVTEQSNGKVTGIVFLNQIQTDVNTFYTRLEYHHMGNDGIYTITNKCFVGNSKNDISKPVGIEESPWKELKEAVTLINLEAPLYSILKMPGANNIELNSALALPIFSEAIEELKDLDIAYSRNAIEIDESGRIVLIDSDRLLPNNEAGATMQYNNEHSKKRMKLPRFLRSVDSLTSDSAASMYQEINPNLNTEERIKGINALLSQIGFKCGFSNGYFVFDEKTGLVTATQVEADQQRTIQLIKDVRDQLQTAIDGLIYALSAFADLYYLAPVGKYEVTYDFGDITYNRDEDRLRWWQYVQSGKMPAWLYFVKFEGLTEEEAKTLTTEAQPKETGLFED